MRIPSFLAYFRSGWFRAKIRAGKRFRQICRDQLKNPQMCKVMKTAFEV
jgi:hypothetical protein